MGFLDSLCPIEKPQFAIGDKVKYKDDFRNAKYGEGVITGYHDEQIICKFKKSDCPHYFSHRKFKSELETYKVKTLAEKLDRDMLYVPKGFYCDDFMLDKIINVYNGKIAQCTKEEANLLIFTYKTTEHCFNKAYFDQARIQVNSDNYVMLNERYYQWFLDYFDGNIFENKFKVVSTKFNWYKLSAKRLDFDSCGYCYVDFWLPSCLFRAMTYGEFCGIPQLIHKNNAKLVEQVDPTEELAHFFPNEFQKEETKMNKHDLETGMIVKFEDGREFVVAKDGIFGDLLIGYNTSFDLLDFLNNMNHKTYEKYNIVKVYKPLGYANVCLDSTKSNRRLIWERNKTREIPMSDVMDILAEKLGCEKDRIKITG